VIPIDVTQLIDRLESLVSSGARVPLTSRAIVDEHDFLEIVDQLRIAVPEEIRQAKRLSQDKERIIHQAQGEADKLLEEARQQATHLLQENELVRAAEQYSEQTRREAEQHAEEIRRGADTYSLEVLGSLETELMKLLATVRRGKTALERSVRDPSSDSTSYDQYGRPDQVRPH
jgi:cell division septum initiation protein DivIVA